MASAKPPVPTRADPLIENLHGVAVADPYRWLEDAAAPEVQRWTEQQNAFTRRTLDAFPGRQALTDRFWQLYEIGSLGVPVPRHHGHARRYFYTRRDGKQNQPVLYVRDGIDGADRALVDVNALAADGTRALDWWFPSDDGALVAYGVSADGDEESTLRVRDVATGHDLPDEIARARACSLAWFPDGKGFYYTRYPDPGSVPAGEEKYHRGVTSWAAIRPRTTSCSARAAISRTGRASACHPAAAGWPSRWRRAGRRARSTSSTPTRRPARRP